MSLPKILWKESPNCSDRTARVDLIVNHDTEGSYVGSVAWFAQSQSKVSVHYVLKEDGSEVTQMVELADKAWACCAFNSRSVNIEMAGWANKGYDSAEWDALANINAFLLHHLQIPCKWARGGIGPGFCRHYDLGVAGGNHSDPTTDLATWQRFVSLVMQKYDAGDFPLDWSPADDPTACSLKES